MYACQWRDSVSCLRNLFFFFIVHSFVIHGDAAGGRVITRGSAQDSNRKIKGKILLESYPKEDKIRTSNSPRRDTPLSHRGKITNDDKPYHDFGKQYSNNQRQKRSATPLADEDLFEFMVRIANTPAEWERIRRVLSLINQAERKSDPDNTTPTPTTLRNRTETHVSRDRVENGTKSNVSANARSVDVWPSNKWIRSLLDSENDEKVDFADEDEYFEPEDEEDEENEEEDEDDDSTNDINYKFEQNKSITNRTTNVVSNDDSSRMIIPNEKLPNFVYRRVKPAVADSNGVENAYIAVSVVSPHSILRKQYQEADSTTQRPTTVTPSPMDTQFELIQKYLLQKRQRHSRRKYEKT